MKEVMGGRPIRLPVKGSSDAQDVSIPEGLSQRIRLHPAETFSQEEEGLQLFVLSGHLMYLILLFQQDRIYINHLIRTMTLSTNCFHMRLFEVGKICLG